MSFQFYKYQALGNDMIVIDPATFDYPLTPATVRLICDRHWGVGGDGICYGPLRDAPHPRAMRFFNPDGSESGKSGNGLRIFARYLWDRGLVPERKFEVWINNEPIWVTIKDETGHTLAMEMGRLSFWSQDIPVSGPAREVVEEVMTLAGIDYTITAVTIGNPHCVIFADDVSAGRIQQIGPLLEIDLHFSNRTNAQLARVLDRHAIQIEIWERGAGYTLASGTSACATAGAAIKTGRCDDPVEVRMAGGAASVSIDEHWQVTLTGPVEAVAQGTFADDLVGKFGRQ